MRCKNFPPEVDLFIRNHVSKKSNAELTKIVNHEFGTNYSTGQIIRYKNRHRLKSGFKGGESGKGRPNAGQFKKGHETWSKGKKGFSPQGSEKGWFKKGGRPHNWMPVGTERISRDGYLEIKTADPNVWVAKHRIVWESANGDIPAGHMVVFMDGDRRNFDLGNLALISQAENAMLNNYIKRSCSAEVNKVKITQAKLLLVQARRRKEVEA